MGGSGVPSVRFYPLVRPILISQRRGVKFALQQPLELTEQKQGLFEPEGEKYQRVIWV